MFENFTTLLTLCIFFPVGALFYKHIFSRLAQPFIPIFDYYRCRLGLNIDDFMEAPPCNRFLCNDTNIEDREITNDNGIGADIETSALEVNTVDDCFDNMIKVNYGARVSAKIVDDVSCDDQEYEDACKELIAEQRIIEEDNCELPG